MVCETSLAILLSRIAHQILTSVWAANKVLLYWSQDVSVELERLQKEKTNKVAANSQKFVDLLIPRV